MPFLTDAALDAGLNHVKLNGTTIHVCSSEPADYTAATGAASLGSAAITFTGPADAPTGSTGRILTVTTSAGSTYVTGGTATHYAVVSGTLLLATGAFAVAKNVNAGDAITVENFDIAIRDAVAA